MPRKKKNEAPAEEKPILNEEESDETESEEEGENPSEEEAPAEEAAPFVLDHTVHVRLEDKGHIEHEGAAGKERRILVDGQNYEHVSTDPDGVWVYRAM